MTNTFSFSKKQFNRLFPFYMLINRELKIIDLGTSLRKLFGKEKAQQFNHTFLIPRPLTLIHSFDDLIQMQDQLVILQSAASQEFKIRGQFEYLTEKDEIIFVGSPWFSSMEQLRDHNLMVNDFASHDPLIDLLHMMKTQEITNDDLKELATTIDKQKSDLKKANKEIHDIALFPMQNPDPLIRINFNGDVLQNNPAAALLDFFEFENKVYRNDEFFKLVSATIDLSNSRWVIEASSGNKDYSFLCVSMKEERYINVYGRDISQQKKDRTKLERLSLVASANENGVLFTNPEGMITWANEGFCKLIGYTQEDLIGKSPIQLCKGTLTDESTLYQVLESFFKGEVFSAEIIFYRKDKSWFWGRAVSQPIKNEKGTISEFFGIIQDVTEEKASEEKLKILSQIAEDNINAVVVTDKEGKITWVNKSFIEMTGYSFEESIGTKPGHLLQGQETDKSTVEYLGKQINNGEPFNAEIINYSKNGNKFWLRVTGQPIKNESGEVTGFFALEEDVTKEKESEHLFRNALENIGDNVWERDFKTGKTYFSKTGNEFLGYEADDFTNNQDLWGNCVYPEDFHLLIENERQYQAGEINSHSLEYRIRHKDGSTKWVLDRGVVIEKDKYGNPLRITGTHADITERKNAEEILEKQRKFYEDILNNMPADIAVFNAKHEYLFVNPRGIKDKELRKWIIGKRDEDYCKYRNKPLIIAEGRREIFNKVLDSKSPSEWEEKNTTPAGDEQYILRRWYPVVDKENIVTLIIGYGIDITERKKFENALKINEEKYRGIIDNMNLGLMEMDEMSKITYANRTLAYMAGVGEENILGFDSTNLLVPESVDLVHTKGKNRKAGISEAYELRVTVSNEIKWWLVSSAPKYDEAGVFTGSIVICLDISERKELEKQLIISREKAEQLAKTKEIFLANMSHEIRTPINAILGLSNQLIKSNPAEQDHNYLTAIQSATNSLLVIINDILDLSKIEAGKLSLNRIGFDIRAVISNSLLVFAYKAEEKAVRLTNSVTDNAISPVLLGDPYRLSQVLSNLLSNAIKFTEEGAVDVQINLKADKEHAQLIEFIVTDTGIGMDDSFADQLFEKFSQENVSISHRYGGTGLGMSICKEIVSLMGGLIQVESKKGQGTRVSVLIEFEKGTDKDLVKKGITDFKADFLKGKRILIIDDNEMNRLVASTILRSYGALILESVNGKEGVDLLEVQGVDIVLMDIQMPVLNGYEAIQKIRQSGNAIPVIALTAYANQGEREKCLAAGMNDYLSKPFKEDEFLSMISNWLGQGFSKKDFLATVPNTQVLFSLSKLHEISKGNADFDRKMIQLLLEQFPVATIEINEAYTAHNLAKVKSVAHRIKPMIDNLEISSLTTEIRLIEKLAGEGIRSNELEQYIQKLGNIISQVVVELQAYK